MFLYLASMLVLELMLLVTECPKYLTDNMTRGLVINAILNISFCLSLCLSISLSQYLYHLPLYLSTYLSDSLSKSLYSSLSLCLYISLSPAHTNDKVEIILTNSFPTNPVVFPVVTMPSLPSVELVNDPSPLSPLAVSDRA